jgi:signal peptidase I
MEGTSPGLVETLANLSILKILWIVAGLTVVRLALVRIPAQFARSIADTLESALIAVVLVFMVIRPFVVQAYFIPSPSMEPTLLGKDNVGDRILVSKYDYRFHAPRRDDVVVFLAPLAATQGTGTPADSDFIKRLIGRPGDQIKAVRGRVIVDGVEYNHQSVRNKLGASGIFGQDAMASLNVDQADHHVKFASDGVWADKQFISKPELAKALVNNPQAKVTIIPGYNIRNGQKLSEPFIAEDPDYDLQFYHGLPLKHMIDSDAFPGAARDIYQLQSQTISAADYAAYAATPAEQIPPHRLLMMGDNRNDSNDGTAWGLLDDKRVVGHAVFIFWPLSRMHPIH